MTERTKAILKWEMAGALFMILAGSVLHFVFQWCGRWIPVALVAAVNESVWEHLKLAFWPGVLWALLPISSADVSRSDRLAAKGISLPVTAIVIVVVFTTYTQILGRNLLALDIGTFVVAIFAGQSICAWLLGGNIRNRFLFGLGCVLLALQCASYALFTFQPPDHWLFFDSRTGQSGIPF